MSFHVQQEQQKGSICHHPLWDGRLVGSFSFLYMCGGSRLVLRVVYISLFFVGFRMLFSLFSRPFPFSLCGSSLFFTAKGY